MVVQQIFNEPIKNSLIYSQTVLLFSHFPQVLHLNTLWYFIRGYNFSKNIFNKNFRNIHKSILFHKREFVRYLLEIS